MANHNELRKVSTTPQANTIPYADETGFITQWLENDPLISSLKSENEYIGSVPNAPAPDTQSILTQFVIDTEGRQPRNGDEVAIEDVGELWMFNGTQWVFFTTTTISDATTTSKGLMQVGSGLNVSSGIVSVDSTIYWASRSTVSNSSTIPSIAPAANTDYTFSNDLTSLTLTSIPNSSYYTTLTFVPATGFTFNATGLSQYFYYNTPTFIAGKTYRLTIVNGRCYIDYTGDRVYPINKITSTSPALTATNNIVTWTISNTLGKSDVILRVYETGTGNTVEVDSTVTVSTITLKLYTDSASISAGAYTAVIIG